MENSRTIAPMRNKKDRSIIYRNAAQIVTGEQNDDEMGCCNALYTEANTTRSCGYYFDDMVERKLFPEFLLFRPEEQLTELPNHSNNYQYWFKTQEERQMVMLLCAEMCK